MNEKIFIYRGNPITFDMNKGSAMVNASEMAKSFEKRTADWLVTQSTQTFIKTYSDVRKTVSADLVRVIKGGNGEQGTWMHEDIALEFARWLNPYFAIWCNDRIKELMKFGMTATPETLENMINNPDLVIALATELKASRAENALLKPKAEFTEKVFETEGLVDIGQASKILNVKGVGRNTMFKMLRRDGIFFKHRNEPMQQYVDSGYFNLKEKFVNDFLVRQVYVTQKGLDFLLKRYGNKPVKSTEICYSTEEVSV